MGEMYPWLSLCPAMMPAATGKVEYENIGINNSSVLVSCQPAPTSVFMVTHADSGQGRRRVFPVYLAR